MKINSHTEWDPLKEIIVGRGEGQASLQFAARTIPTPEVLEKAQKLAREAFPQWLIDEINADLEELCAALRKLGVKVHRPTTEHVNRLYVTPYVTAAGDHCYNMRDLHLVVGNNVVESPSQEAHRYFEAMGLYDVWYDYFKEGFRWISGPKPRLKGDYMITYTAEGRDRYDDGQRYIKLKEEEILFEAANTVRMGKDHLYLVSRSGNQLGAKWLQLVLGDEYRVHTTDKIYRSSHIDSTVLCLRPGLVMLNSERVNDSNCPEIFNKWQKVYFSNIEPIPERTLKFHNDVRKKVGAQLASMGISSGLDSVASKWIGMNVLSVDTKTVIVDKIQTGLMREFERLGITPVPISFRHSYYMGGIHCSSLDTVRDSKLESYFD